MPDQLKNFIEPERFSGNVLVARQGEIVFQGVYGYADEERLIPNTIDTKFCVGAINKSMTALCILKLVREGKIELADPVEKFFNHLYPDRGITVHHLLTHTSGIKNHLSVKGFKNGKNYVVYEVIKKISAYPLEFKPGEQFLYSHTGYALLGTIIEKVTGRNLQDYIRATILTPLRMDDSFFVGENVDNLAKPGKPRFECKPGLLYASGALISTVKDLFRYDQALYGEDLASRSVIEEMMKPWHNGKFVKYGYGWFIKNLFGRRSVAHGGHHPAGYSAHLERYLNDRTTIIVVSNKLQKYSRFGIRYLNSTDVARELAGRIYEKKVKFWEKWY